MSNQDLQTVKNEINKLKKLSLSTTFLDEKKNVKLETKEQIYSAVMAYFTDVKNNKKQPSMTGLALSLGITRSDLLSASNNDPQIQSIVNRAKMIIVDYVEQALLSGRPPVGLIFWLKNNDNWVDKTEVAHTTKSAADILRELAVDLPIQEGQVVN